MGRELPPGHPFNEVMAPNIWVDSIPGFRESTLALYEAFDALGLRLLSAIARSVALPANFFDDKVNLGNSVLRVIHYPPMPPEPTPSVRAGAHEDINVITLLLGAEEPGLEVLSRKGEWLPINPPPGSLVCNVGDMLQRLTNMHLRSTTHRVVNPPRERASNARYSLPFFLHFNPDFLIKTLPQYVDAQHPDQFPVPINAQDFLRNACAKSSSSNRRDGEALLLLLDHERGQIHRVAAGRAQLRRARHAHAAVHGADRLAATADASTRASASSARRCTSIRSSTCSAQILAEHRARARWPACWSTNRSS